MTPEDRNVALAARRANGEDPRSRKVAVTVKLDEARYQKLKLHGLATRQSGQDIIVKALDRYLES